MSVSVILATSIGFIASALCVARQVAFWQRKEYRFDRMRSYLLSDEFGAHISPLLIVFYGSLAIVWLLASGQFITTAAVLQWIPFILPLLFLWQDTRTRGFTRPKATLKALTLTAIVSVAVIIAAVRISMSPAFHPLQWATFIFFIPLIAALLVPVVNAPFYLRKRQVINSAAAKRQRLPRLKVIGITGSVGKTSTKHFLNQILQAAGHKVTATAEHRNSEYAVAEDFLARVQKETDIYIAEMGAYKMGEIAAICRIVQPQTGIMTAIGNQHLALFGSQENIAAAKSELIAALPPEGTAILNADDKNIQAIAKKTKAKILWYSTQTKADVYVTNTTFAPRSTQTTLHINEEQHQITTPIISAGLLNSIIAAIAAAVSYGISPKQIVSALAALSPFPHTMEIISGLSESTIIDDSYSASEASVTNALHHLKSFTQADKRVALVPVMELGQEGHSVHHRLGEAIKQTPATYYIYGHAYREDLIAGAGEVFAKKHIRWHTDPLAFAEEVSQNVTKNTVILLEGRMPDVIHKAISA